MKAALFDLDGTLVDSLADIGGAMNHVLGELGRPTLPIDAYRGLVGYGASELVRGALSHGAPGGAFDAAFVESTLVRYRARYAAHLVVDSRPYEGIAELLAGLAARGVPMAVVTNKPHALSLEMVARLFPDVPFVEVFGQRAGAPHKPDPSDALAVARRLGLAPRECAFVGDSDTDMKTAHNAGMIAVGCAWGFRGRAELEAHGAHHVLDDPRALLGLAAPRP